MMLTLIRALRAPPRVHRVRALAAAVPAHLEADFVASLRRDCGVGDGDHVVASVSGGCDSVALLHLLARTRERFDPPLAVSVATFDHGTRGGASREDAAFVAALAARYGLACETHAWAGGGGTQASYRAWRRDEASAAAASAAAGTAPAAHVALGHHADDQVEGFLLRLARGSRLTKVAAGMAPRFGVFVRPLLSATKDDLRAYLDGLGEAWREDASNADPTAYRRNAARLDVAPALAEFCGGRDALRARLAALKQQSAFYDAWVAAEADAVLKAAARPDGGLDLAVLVGAPVPVRHEALNRFCRAAVGDDAYAVPFARLLEADARIVDAADGAWSLDLPRALALERVGGRLAARPAAPPPPPPPRTAGRVEVAGELARLRVVEGDPAGAAMGAVPPRLALRQPRPGDLFHAPWRPSSTKLAQFLRGQGVAAGDRGSTPVLADAATGAILAVFLPGGPVVARPHAPDADDAAAYRLRVTEAAFDDPP